MWMTPKTNWKIQPKVNGLYNGDWFNVDPDYVRIKGNIEHLAGMAVMLGYRLSQQPMEPQSMTGFPSAGMMNRLEDNVAEIAEETEIQYSGAVTWANNGSTPTVLDLNRIEGFCLRAYEMLLMLAAAQTKLSFGLAQQLGGSEF